MSDSSHLQTRETPQRRAVYEAIDSSRSHPSVEWIFDRVRSQMPRISLGTVYRNLAILKREGLIRELIGSDRRSRYEVNSRPHAHFVCTSCGQIRDVEGIDEPDWRTLKDLVGCDVIEHLAEFRGLCPACRHKSRATP
jgi:Fe2+ or Zn2+ uptake regulation protein